MSQNLVFGFSVNLHDAIIASSPMSLCTIIALCLLCGVCVFHSLLNSHSNSNKIGLTTFAFVVIFTHRYSCFLFAFVIHFAQKAHVSFPIRILCKRFGTMRSTRAYGTLSHYIVLYISCFPIYRKQTLPLIQIKTLAKHM